EAGGVDGQIIGIDGQRAVAADELVNRVRLPEYPLSTVALLQRQIRGKLGIKGVGASATSSEHEAAAAGLDDRSGEVGKRERSGAVREDKVAAILDGEESIRADGRAGVDKKCVVRAVDDVS